jgi:hypothetical protein
MICFGHLNSSQQNQNPMSTLLIFGLWILNLVISYFNARTVGLAWAETKMIGGWQRFMTWMGAIMAASGFTYCYVTVLLIGAYFIQGFFLKPGQHLIITPKDIEGGFSLAYLFVIPGVLFSGLMIWIDSLAQAWRNRDLPSMGIAGWNTFAQIHNMYEAFEGIPGAFKSVGDLFSKDDDDDNAGAIIVIFLVVLAFAAGILTTWGIIKHYAGSRPMPARPSMARVGRFAK